MITPRAHVRGLAPVHHGSIGDAELARLGRGRDEIVDFSVNANPLGPSAAAVAAARTAAWGHYPDDRAEALREELGRRAGVGADRVVVANGSAELIWLAAIAYLEPGDSAVVVGPTFGEYARAAAVAGGVVHEHRTRAEDGFGVNVDAVAALADERHARLVFVCNPNNPTGVLLPTADLVHLARALPDALVMVDEAYMPFVDKPPSSAPLLDLGNVVLLRSLTKDQAMAGLRLGYAVGSAATVDALDRVRPPWSVNAVAQAAGLAGVRDGEHLRRARAEVGRARAYVAAALTALGLRVLPSAANYVLVEVGDGAAARAALLRHGVVVRDCASFGLPAFIRVGLRTVPECGRLIAACAAVGPRALAGAAGG